MVHFQINQSMPLHTSICFSFLENTNVNGGIASNYHNARLKDANDADNIKIDFKDQTQITFSSSLNKGELIKLCMSFQH